MYMYVHEFVCKCMHACMYVCMCMYMYAYVRMHALRDVSVRACVFRIKI